MATNKLTEKQRIFVDEYLIDLNATQAAIKAGYSKNAAKEIAYENLTKPHIQKAIDKRKKNLSIKNKITVEKIIKEYSEIALVDIYKEDIKASDKLKALDYLTKLLGLELNKNKKEDGYKNKTLSDLYERD